MKVETLQFLYDLYARCALDETPAYLTLSAIHPDGDRPTPSRHVRLGDVAGLTRTLERLLAANGRGWGAYFGVALRRANLGRWSRGGRNDLSLLPALFVDIDDGEAALARLAWFDLPPTAILRSGHGYHAYWFLEKPTADLVMADRALHGLGARLGGDAALTVANSMRLPGTINTKPGRENALCTLERHCPERLYRLDEFSPYLPIIRQPPLLRYRSERAPAPDRQSLIATVTEAVLTVLDGHPKGNGFIAARCPCCHQRDRVGMHFSYHPESGTGHCFGKHGHLSLRQMCELLGISMPDTPPAQKLRWNALSAG